MSEPIIPPRHGLTEEHWPSGWMFDSDIVHGSMTYLLKQCQKEGVQSIRPLRVGMIEVKVKGDVFKVSWEHFYQGMRKGGMTLPWRLFGSVMTSMLDMTQQADRQSRAVVRVGNSVVFDARRQTFLLDS